MSEPALIEGEILVVDDSPDDISVIRTILAEQGYRVRTAINAELSLNSIRKKVPNLILLDIMMPGMDGFQACEIIKSDPDPNIKNIPIIFISALDDTLDKVKAFAVGGLDFITKPFAQEEVLARIQTHLKLRQTQLQLEIVNQHLRQEINERNKAEQSLQQSESQLSVVFENTSDLQLLWAVEPNDEFRVLAVNKAYLAAAQGYGIEISENDIVGKTMDEVVLVLGLDRDTRESVFEKYKLAKSRGKPVKYSESIEIGIGFYHAEITLVPVMDQNGHCQFVLYNSHNVTDLKMTAEALETLNAELDERVRERTEDLNTMVQLMAGREVRMAELKKVIKQLRKQIKDAGLQPVADDPLVWNKD